METKTYTTIDRAAAGWPKGEWDNEPDKVQWPDAKTGLPCLAVRHARYGHWCGYVGVPPGHEFHGKEYEEVDVEVHGGLNYSEACRPRVCHVPGEGEPDDVWWLGFDCGHYRDWSPYDEANTARGYPYLHDPARTYRSLDYVRAQCAELARQLKR